MKLVKYTTRIVNSPKRQTNMQRFFCTDKELIKIKNYKAEILAFLPKLSNEPLYYSSDDEYYLLLDAIKTITDVNSKMLFSYDYLNKVCLYINKVVSNKHDMKNCILNSVSAYQNMTNNLIHLKEKIREINYVINASKEQYEKLNREIVYNYRKLYESVEALLELYSNDEYYADYFRTVNFQEFGGKDCLDFPALFSISYKGYNSVSINFDIVKVQKTIGNIDKFSLFLKQNINNLVSQQKDNLDCDELSAYNTKIYKNLYLLEFIDKIKILIKDILENWHVLQQMNTEFLKQEVEKNKESVCLINR